MRLPTVSSVEEVRINICQYNEELAEGVMSLRTNGVQQWYYIEEIDLFGPSRYIGYKDVTIEKHKNAHLDGGKTEGALKKLGFIVCAEDELKERLIEHLCDQLAVYNFDVRRDSEERQPSIEVNILERELNSIKSRFLAKPASYKGNDDTIDYYPTAAQEFTSEEWLAMLKQGDCFTPVLLEAVCTLVFELNGKGSASQIAEITGRAYQTYNSAPGRTVKSLRERGCFIKADFWRRNSKERFWSHFFLGYYEEGLFVWEVRRPLSDAIFAYFGAYESDEMRQPELKEEITGGKEVIEGTRRQRIHSKLERNEFIVREAKRKFFEKHGSYFCEACNFSFQELYEMDYIEAHHILPLYKGERTTSTMDFLMLCANCHRAVHNKKWNDRPVGEFLEWVGERH